MSVPNTKMLILNQFYEIAKLEIQKQGSIKSQAEFDAIMKRCLQQYKGEVEQSETH